MTRYAALLLLALGCSSSTDCPERPYWNPLTCRCHSNASGGFVANSCCLRDDVSLDACPTTEPDNG